MFQIDNKIIKQFNTIYISNKVERNGGGEYYRRWLSLNLDTNDSLPVTFNF